MRRPKKEHDIAHSFSSTDMLNEKKALLPLIVIILAKTYFLYLRLTAVGFLHAHEINVIVASVGKSCPLLVFPTK